MLFKIWEQVMYTTDIFMFVYVKISYGQNVAFPTWDIIQWAYNSIASIAGIWKGH